MTDFHGDEAKKKYLKKKNMANSVVFGLLFKSVLGHCATSCEKKQGFFFDPGKTKVLEKSRTFSSNRSTMAVLGNFCPKNIWDKSHF